MFDAVRRELAEELHFDASNIAAMRCTGIAEDQRLRHPELMFAVTSTRSRNQIESKLDRAEHHETWATPATQAGIQSAIEQRNELTPIAIASLLLWGRLEFGDEWFRAADFTL